VLLKKDSNQFGDDPFVKHEPCLECGSSDALARYSSGSAHCFSCNHHIQVNGNVVKLPTQPRRPLEQMTGTISPIQDRRISQETAKKFNVTVEHNADGSIKIGIIYLIILSFLSWLTSYILFRKGYKIKS
jgi:hypothetical protein